MTSPPTPHASLAAGRWHTFTLAQQLGNVGSEVERALRAHEQGRADRFERALERALELFDLTAVDPRWNVHRRREILRAREQFCRVFYDEHAEPSLPDYLRKYFLQFAVAARRSEQR
jgi:hypothetical protein